MKNQILRLAAITAIVFNSACAKKGDTGPEGPAGPQGPAGTQGQPGPAGNANVKSVGPLFVPPFAWTTTDSTSWQASMPVAGITQEIANGGMVQVYKEDGAKWWALPFSEGDEYIMYGVEPGKVNLIFSHSHATQLERPESANFRVVYAAPAALSKPAEKEQVGASAL